MLAVIHNDDVWWKPYRFRLVGLFFHLGLDLRAARVIDALNSLDRTRDESQFHATSRSNFKPLLNAISVGAFFLLRLKGRKPSSIALAEPQRSALCARTWVVQSDVQSVRLLNMDRSIYWACELSCHHAYSSETEASIGESSERSSPVISRILYVHCFPLSVLWGRGKLCRSHHSSHFN